MPSQLPLGEISRYTAKEAASELKQIEINALQKFRACLETRAYDEIVNLLLGIDEEVTLTVSESRRLRLQGKLDVNIFNVLIKGYSDIKEKIFDLSDQYGLLKEVRSLYNFNKYAGKVSKRI